MSGGELDLDFRHLVEVNSHRSLRAVLAERWLAASGVPAPQVTESRTLDGDMDGSWIFRDCDISGVVPWMLWGAWFDRCRFRPFWSPFMFDGALVLHRCDVPVREPDKGLEFFASHTRISRAEGWTPRVGGIAWLHECELVDIGDLFVRRGCIVSGPDGTVLQGRIAEQVPESLRSGWALAAWFSTQTNIAVGARVTRFDAAALQAIREIYRAQFDRTRLPGAEWLDLGGLGFAYLHRLRLAVFRVDAAGLAFWSGLLPSHFADQALGLVGDELWLPVLDEHASPLPR